MSNKMKVEVKLLSVNSEWFTIRYSSKEKTVIKTLRLHELPYNSKKPDFFSIREDIIYGTKDIDYPIKNAQITGVTFIVKDETNKEQYSVGIDFLTKQINIKEMMYEVR